MAYHQTPGSGAPYPSSAAPYPPVNGAAPYPPAHGAAPYPPAGGMPYPQTSSPYPQTGMPGAYPQAAGGAGYHPPAGGAGMHSGYPSGAQGPMGGYPGSYPAGYPGDYQGGYPAGGGMMMPIGGAPMMASNSAVMMNPIGGMVAVPMRADIVVANDTMDAFSKMIGCVVEQEAQYLENLTGWEQRNKYKLFSWDPTKIGGVNFDVKAGRGPKLFELKEQSDCCVRQCCGKSRSFDMSVVPEPSIATGRTHWTGDKLNHPDSIAVIRPFKCTCLCFNRPIIFLKTGGVSGGRFSTVRMPWSACEWVFEVNAASPDDEGMGPISPAVKAGERWFTVVGSACQAAAWCFLPMDGCNKVRFFIYAASDVARTSPLGEINRVFNGCGKQMLSDADTYTVSFPAGASPMQKAALAMTSVLLDFMLFERDSSSNSGSTMMDIAS